MDKFIILAHVSDGFTFGFDIYEMHEGTPDSAMARAVEIEQENPKDSVYYNGPVFVYRLGEQIV